MARSFKRKKETVAEFLTKAIEMSGKAQKKIAKEAGFLHPNIITMFKQGITQVPLTRIGALAEALNVDPSYFLRLVLMEYQPETYQVIEDILKTPILTAREKKLIESYRHVFNDSDPECLFVTDEIRSVAVKLKLENV